MRCGVLDDHREKDPRGRAAAEQRVESWTGMWGYNQCRADRKGGEIRRTSQTNNSIPHPHPDWVSLPLKGAQEETRGKKKKHNHYQTHTACKHATRGLFVLGISNPINKPLENIFIKKKKIAAQSHALINTSNTHTHTKMLKSYLISVQLRYSQSWLNSIANNCPPISAWLKLLEGSQF